MTAIRSEPWDMDPDDELLRKADEAQQWAERSRSPAIKAGWLSIARRWRSLLSKSSPSSEPLNPAEAEGAGGSR